MQLNKRNIGEINPLECESNFNRLWKLAIEVLNEEKIKTIPKSLQTSPMKILTPKKSNCFHLKIPNIPHESIISAEFPRYSNGTWLPMKISLLDCIENNVSLECYKLLRTIESIGHFYFSIEQFDSFGKAVGDWIIKVKGIEFLNFGAGDFLKNENIIIGMVIIPEDCIYSKFDCDDEKYKELYNSFE